MLGKITSLGHEFANYSVESCVQVAVALFVFRSYDRFEILNRDGHSTLKKFELHLAEVFTVPRDFHEGNWIVWVMILALLRCSSEHSLILPLLLNDLV